MTLWTLVVVFGLCSGPQVNAAEFTMPSSQAPAASAAWRTLRCSDAMMAHLRSRSSSDIGQFRHDLRQQRDEPSREIKQERTST
jgi:hypothetical protein